MNRNRISLLILLAVISSVVLLPARSSAQWNVAHTFQTGVNCVYVMPSNTQIQFVALVDATVWRTTDGGTTWSQIMSASQPVSSFEFRNANVGWLSCGSQPWALTAVYRTVNGGATWTATSVTGAISQVYYNSQTSRVTALNWYAASSYSTDDGVTWTTFPLQGMNGTAWTTPSVGVMANTVLAQRFLYTSNAGQTWQTSNLTQECFAPLAVPCQGLFFATTEYGDAVYRSANNGVTWQTVYSPNLPMGAGCIEGDASNLFIQTNSDVRMSTDQGSTWTSIGGPGGSYDKRFVVLNGVIYIGDANGKYYINTQYQHNSGSTLSLTAARVDFPSRPCSSSDTTITLFAGCGSLTVQSVSLATPDPSFVITPASPLPQTITTSLGIHLTYTGSTNDSNFLHIHYLIGAQTYDTTVRIVGHGFTPQSIGLPTTASVVSPMACQDSSLTATIRNLHCDTTWITSITLDDPTHFQLQNVRLPVGLAPNGSLTLNVNTSSPLRGVFHAHVRVHYSNTYLQGDTTITLTLTVLRANLPQWTLHSLTVPDACPRPDSSITVTNPGCDTLVITGANFNGLAGLSFPPGTFPVHLAPGASVKLPLHVTVQHPIVQNGTVTLHMTMDTAVYDSSFAFQFQMLKDIRPTPLMTPSAIDFGKTSLCYSLDTTIVVSNPLCLPITINSGKLQTGTIYTLTKHPAYPSVLAPGASDTFTVHFAPPTNGATSDLLQLNMTANGNTHDTSINVQGIGSSDIVMQLSNTMLQFDTLAACTSKDLPVTLVNSNCYPVQLISLTQFHDPDLSLAQSPALPITLKPGDTLHLMVHFASSSPTSTQDSLVFTVQGAGGLQWTSAVTVSAHSTVSPLALSTSQLVLDNLAPCTMLDTVVYVSNRTTCDYTVDSVVLVGVQGALTVSPKLSAVLHPGDSLAVHLNFQPAAGMSGRGAIVIRGPEVDTAVSIELSSSAGKVISLSTTKLIADSLTPCTRFDTTVMVMNRTTCDYNIDSVLLSGISGVLTVSPKLSAVLRPGDSLAIHVSFQPTAGATGRGAILIKGPQVDTAIAIQLSTRSEQVLAVNTPTLLLDKLSPCVRFDTMVTVKNISHCDYTIDSVVLTGVASTMLTQPMASRVLKPGDTMTIRLSITPPANFVGDGTIILMGASVDTSVSIHLTSLPNTSLALGSSHISFDSLSPCLPFDTTLIIRNPTACDFEIDSVQLSGLSATMDVSPNPIIILHTGDSVAIHLTLAAIRGFIGDGAIRLYGPSLDTSITIHVSTSNVINASFTVQQTDVRLKTVACVGRDTTITVMNTSCLPVTIDSAWLSTSGAFALVSGPTLPKVLKSGESMKLQVAFAPSNPGSDSTVLSVLSNGTGIQRTVRIAGIEPPVPQASVYLDAPSTAASCPAGGSQDFAITLRDSVAADRRLQTVVSMVHYDSRSLSFVQATGQNGWADSIASATNGAITIVSTMKTASAHAANEKIAVLTFRYFVADTLGGSIGLDKVEFNPTEPTYGNCLLTAQAVTTPIGTGLAPGCANPILSGLLAAELLQSATLQPNPVHQGNATVTVTVLGDVPGQVEIVNNLGTPVYMWQGMLAKGANPIVLPVAGLNSGMYFVQTTVGSRSISNQLVVQH